MDDTSIWSVPDDSIISATFVGFWGKSPINFYAIHLQPQAKIIPGKMIFS